MTDTVGCIEGPRERLLLLGEARLSDAECVALLLRTGCRGETAEVVARRLLRRFAGLGGLAAASVRQVAAEPGVGPVRAAALAAAFGLCRRLAEWVLRPGTVVRHGGDVARLVRASAFGSQKESFYAVQLDVRHRVLGVQVVSVGGLDSTTVSPREVFAPALRDGAHSLVVAHNHPSGDASPSVEDRLVTKRLREVGELVGIQVLDHLVVGQDRYYSFAEEAFLPMG